MKAERGELQKSFGEIRLFPENVDDIWHISHLVSPGDLVFATTFRSTEAASDKLRPEKTEKKPVRLGIRVEKIEFHPYTRRLRVTGLIEHGIDIGFHHTINIEPGFEISVIRQWRAHDLERIERAEKASVHGVLHVLTIEEGEAELYRIRHSGPEHVASVVMGSGKGMENDSRSVFFERVSGYLEPLTGPVVVAGPGFVKEDFMKFLRNRDSDRAARVLVVDTRRAGSGAVQDVIGLGILEKIEGDIQLASEVNFMGEFLRRVSKGEPVAYGRAEVNNAAECGAIEKILVIDRLIHDREILDLMDTAEKSGASVVVFSSEFEPGSRLDALGGVAALLRYHVG